MSKFTGNTSRPVRANIKSPVQTTTPTSTFEGGSAYSRTAESDLFLLAATNMVKENTFYESAEVRDKRFLDLIHTVTASNPEFISGSDPDAGKVGLAEYLRRDLLMRSASVVLAAEYVAAGGPNGRSVVARSLQRPDEPAEMLGYWMSTHGRKIPMAIKRGVADAVRRMYSERNLLRYDGQSKTIRFADVIELVHPKPKDEAQSALFQFALDRRHHEPKALAEYGVDFPILAADAALLAIPEGDRRQYLRDHPDALANAGWAWERLSGWLPGGMDAEAWEAVIPNMGVMALVRNLRNFDQASISDATVDKVIVKITDAEEVAKARLFPYQVWSAYQAAPSDNWKRALGKTIDLTTQNIPDLDGTLVLIDTSGSMEATVSSKSQMKRVEVAAVMAMATAKHCKNSDVVIFGQDSAKMDTPKGISVLEGVRRVTASVGSVGHSTFGHTAMNRWFDPARHKRIVMFTDDQQHDSGRFDLSKVPTIYTVNLAGYGASSQPSGEKGRHTLGGFSDATFKLMQVLEMGRDANWPF